MHGVECGHSADLHGIVQISLACGYSVELVLGRLTRHKYKAALAEKKNEKKSDHGLLSNDKSVVYLNRENRFSRWCTPS